MVSVPAKKRMKSRAIGPGHCNAAAFRLSMRTALIAMAAVLMAGFSKEGFAFSNINQP